MDIKYSKELLPHYIDIEDNTITAYSKTGQQLTKAIPIKSIGEAKLLRISYGHSGVIRDEFRKIVTVYLYKNEADVNDSEYWARLQVLSNLTVNRLR